MGRQIIKVDRDRDLYMEWSSIVEAPTWFGNRVELFAYLTEPVRGNHDEVETRIKRADETGSSGFRPFGCTWDDDGEIYEQRGMLPRARMLAFAERWLAQPESAAPDVTDLLELFDRSGGTPK